MAVEELELIPGRFIGSNHPVFIVAEIGQNHQGDVNLAKEMIRKAKLCGADCVKFQKSNLTEKFTQQALARSYNSQHSFGNTYGEHKFHLEFSEETYKDLQNFCQNEVKIAMTASAMDEKSVEFLDEVLNVPFIKIGSGDVNNHFVLEKVARLEHRNAVISTGMSNIDQVQNIYKLFKKFRTNFVLLQCTSSYPTSNNDVNLNVIDEYKIKFPDIHVGYSGHELGFLPTLGAVAKGAKVIERHFTLDKTMKGNDHACSLDVAEFTEMVQAIRILENALGSPSKHFLSCEQNCFDKLGKSVVASRFLSHGHKIEITDLKIKVAEPKGWPAQDIWNLVGSTLLNDVDIDESITKFMVEKNNFLKE